MNSVSYILKHRPVSLEEKIHIKLLGRPTPALEMTSTVKCKTREFNRYFSNKTTYDRYPWMCGCPETNKIYCFICLLSSDLRATPWIKPGLDDLRHLNERASKHAQRGSHLSNALDFHLLATSPTIIVRTELDGTYVTCSIEEHNKTIDKNRLEIRRLAMCVKVCGAFKQDERIDSQNGSFRSLVRLASELDSAFKAHLSESKIFLDPSRVINELLDVMLSIYRAQIKDEIKRTRFVAVEVDETTDSRNKPWVAVILRYVVDGKIFERFWRFICPRGRSTQSIYENVLQDLIALEVPSEKVVAQSYNGTQCDDSGIVNGAGIQTFLKQYYPYAHFIHGYTHQATSILEKAASCHKKLDRFFVTIQSLSQFILQSPKRKDILDELINKNGPTAIPATWNYDSPTVINSICENKELLLEYFDKIVQENHDAKTILQTKCLLRNMKSAEFTFILETLHHITPQLVLFLNQLQSLLIDIAIFDILSIQNCIYRFQAQISEIRDYTINSIFDRINSCDQESEDQPRGQHTELLDCISAILKQYCNILIEQIKDRCQFTGFMAATSLFLTNMYDTYRETFPEEAFNDAIKIYPFIGKVKLRAELAVIYARKDLHKQWNCNGVLPLFSFLTKNNLAEIFSETHKLLEVICTAPMMTCERGRCFSTLKRIKCFLKNTKTYDRLEALAMLSVEKKLIQKIPDLEGKVLEVFSNMEHRKVDFKRAS